VFDEPHIKEENKRKRPLYTLRHSHLLLLLPTGMSDAIDNFLEVESCARRRLSLLKVPNPNADNEGTRKELSSAKVSSILNSLSNDIRRLQSILPTISSAPLREQYGAALEFLQTTAKQAAAAHANQPNESARSSLFSTTSPHLRNRFQQGNKKNSESNSIAAALSRTKRQMELELERVSEISETITNDCKNMKSVGSEHDTLKGIMTSARGLIKGLDRQDVMETFVVAGGLVFFFSCVLFVLWSRLPGFGLF